MIRRWISLLYCNVESGVINAGFMTNYFRVSRGVRQGCPLSPLLFVLAVEILASKVRHDEFSRDINLPDNKESKISQFADDTTLIVNDIDSLSAAISIIDSFSKISGIVLNQKKTKALWIGSNKQNKNRPLGFECPSEPLRFLGTYLPHKEEENIKKHFSIKIQKMETKLNLWLTRDLTLLGRTMLAKSLGISQLIYSASMLSVPEPVINQTQGKFFAFLWRNKKDRIKRQALYQPLAKGGLSFPCFRTAVKALRLSWIGRILSDSNDNWKAIPNHYLEKHGGLSFLLKCNYDIKYLDNRLPSFYRELLRFFHELRSQYESPLKRGFILWNNKEILIDKKPVFWKPWYYKKIFFIKDLLTDSGDFLSFNQFKEKYNIETNFLQYYQMISAIPSILKQKSAEQGDSQMNKLSTKNTFFLSENKLINFDEFRCKQYYELFIESSACVPTAISSWGKNHPVIANSWESAVASTYKITSDNKLRQFSFNHFTVSS